MRIRNNLNDFYNWDRKILYVVLSVVVISLLCLTIVYAALSTTLNINGNAEVTAASWDIHFDNIQVNPGSVDATTEPKITDSRTVNFDVGLKEPGDYYKFTVDIVNEGTIDAMIDSVVKTPELTTEQAKYIKYEIEYIDGNLISSKQLLSRDSARTISILVSYRSDVSSTDIPTEGDSLNLSFSMIYTQADSSGTEILENTKLVRVVSGDLNTIGSEICIGEECFYLIKNDGSSVTLFSKYNLLVGNRVDTDSYETSLLQNATGVQDSMAVGGRVDANGNNIFPFIGTVAFTSKSYWADIIETYPSYVYNSNSILYEYIENYRNYLNKLGIFIDEARLISYEELEELGCSSSEETCLSALSWVYSSSYWTGSAYASNRMWRVSNQGIFKDNSAIVASLLGVRPVIRISLMYF